MMRHVAKKYTRKLRRPAGKGHTESEKPEWDVRHQYISDMHCLLQLDGNWASQYCYGAPLREGFDALYPADSCKRFVENEAVKD